MAEKLYFSVYLSRVFSGQISSFFITSNELCVIGLTSSPSRIFIQRFVPIDLCLRYSSLVDFWCVDYLEYFSNVRFELNYRFRALLHLGFYLVYSIHLNSTKQFVVPSIMSNFPSADWLEREILDLYGVFFIGNQNMRRLLTDYGFSGYPFRKDFPLCGYTEIRYDDEQTGLVIESISLTQNFRSFSQRNISWSLIFF